MVFLYTDKLQREKNDFKIPTCFFFLSPEGMEVMCVCVCVCVCVFDMIFIAVASFIYIFGLIDVFPHAS